MCGFQFESIKEASEPRTTTGVHHFEATNLMGTIRMPGHKHSQQQITRKRKAAYAGRIVM